MRPSEPNFEAVLIDKGADVLRYLQRGKGTYAAAA